MLKPIEMQGVLPCFLAIVAGIEYEAAIVRLFKVALQKDKDDWIVLDASGKSRDELLLLLEQDGPIVLVNPPKGADDALWLDEKATNRLLVATVAYGDKPVQPVRDKLSTYGRLLMPTNMEPQFAAGQLSHHLKRMCKGDTVDQRVLDMDKKKLAA